MNRPKFLLYPLGLLVLSAGIVWAGQTTLTTYYPSPTGYYNQLFAQNIGIGTTAPGTLLDIKGVTAYYDGVRLIGNNTNTQGVGLELDNTPAGGHKYSLFSSGSSNFIGTGGAGIYDETIGGSAGYRFAINSNGNVSIGTFNPLQLLTIGTSNTTHNRAALGVSDNGDVLLNSQGTLFFDNNYNYAAGSYIGPFSNTSGTYDANTQKFSTSGKERMRIDSGGNVGIGITTPVNILSVRGTTNYGVAEIMGNGTDVESTLGMRSSNIAKGASGDWLIGPNVSGVPTGDFGIWAGGFGNLMTMTTTGNVGIGVTAPTALLNVVQSTSLGTPAFGVIKNFSGGGDGVPTAGIFGIDSGVNATGIVIGLKGSGGFGGPGNAALAVLANGSQTALFAYDGSATINGHLQVNGSINATGTITANSDKRLKQNIVPLTGALSKLDQLRGVSFEWNHSAVSMGLKEGQKNIGMIAQELQKVYPELVVASNGPQKYLSIDYGKFTAVLLQSVKELKSQMNAMQEKINVLQREVKTLEKQK